MDKETLIAVHKSKSIKKEEEKFIKKCKKLEEEIAEAEKIFNSFPPLEEISNPNERFKQLYAKTKLEDLKHKLVNTKALYTQRCYEQNGINGIPKDYKSVYHQIEPGE